MPTTLTVTLPDEIASRLLKLPEVVRDHVVEEALLDVFDESDSNNQLDDEDDFPPETTVFDLYGVAKGRPGAIGEDVDGYISRMRDEWEERSKQWE